jgi:hypothetical protein
VDEGEPVEPRPVKGINMAGRLITDRAI